MKGNAGGRGWLLHVCQCWDELAGEPHRCIFTDDGIGRGHPVAVKIWITWNLPQLEPG